jgi:predicted amidohydrolase
MRPPVDLTHFEFEPRAADFLEMLRDLGHLDDAAFEGLTTAPVNTPRSGKVVTFEEVRRAAAVHLFDAEGLTESSSTMPGTALAVAAGAPCGPVGLSICYDLRFPALYQSLRFDAGARVLAVPAAFTRATGEAHWEVLVRARAIETQCAVVAAAQAGTHNAKRSSHGHTMIVDAWGRVLARVEGGGPGLAVAEIDLAEIARVRRAMPVQDHRRAAVAGVPDLR